MAITEQLFLEGKEFFSTGHPDESIDKFTRAGKKGCNPVNVYLNRGAAYFIIGERDWSIRDFTRVLEIDADNERAFYYRGIAYLAKGEFTDAVEDLTRSIALNQERSTAFMARGLAHAELDHIDESLQDLKRAIAFPDFEVMKFDNLFGENRTLFAKSMALLKGNREPWSTVMTEDEVNILREWFKNK
ncbi:MAG: tetratricopeptide repeat protein [Desulfobulbaceae bacterium]|nr:tetratricopeptide repeat protein [Desulfobulbaceae bacterium]